MTKRQGVLNALALWGHLAGLAFATDAPASFEQLASLFNYRSVPLDIHESGNESTPGGPHIITLSYAGAHGPVSASLVTPPLAGKHAAIVFVHGLGNKRDEFLAEAILLAKASPPALSLLIDSPVSRPTGLRRQWNPSIENNDRNIHAQAVIDIRRGIDLLAARRDVDPARIAYVGHGYGANWGGILLSIEPRLHAFTLIAGIISLTDVMRSDEPDWADMREALGAENFKRYLASLSMVDPIWYVGHSLGAPVLLQFGRFDPYVSPAMAQRFVDATRPPRREIVYDSGYEVNDPRALSDRNEFLSKNIGIGTIHVSYP